MDYQPSEIGQSHNDSHEFAMVRTFAKVPLTFPVIFREHHHAIFARNSTRSPVRQMISVNTTKLYFVEHSSAEDLQHYIVRMYDLSEDLLRPGKIADKAQKSWVMSGWPASRASTSDGRWVYTLYSNPGGFPFVHALDTVKGVAHCVGFRSPSSDSNAIFNYKLSAKGAKVMVRRADGTVYRVINRNGWKVTKR